MKTFLKILKRIGIALLILILTLILGLVIYLNYESVLARHKIKGTSDYATSVENIEIPDSAVLVGLGEATHGNIEFQELKLTVLKNLVENYDYRAFGLELDFGDGLMVNEYIQGGEGSSVEIAKQMGFHIYQTEQMAALIDWMREYNATASEEDKLRFYGFDMQHSNRSAEYLINFCNERAVPGIENELSFVSLLADINSIIDEDSASDIKQALITIRETLKKDADNYKQSDFDWEYENALWTTTTLEQAMDSYEINGDDYFEYRDQCMAQNVAWILNLESKIGSGKMMIAAHDGHIAKSSTDETTCFGMFLDEMYGDSYFAIGTDFFKANINISTHSMVDENQTRKNHRFCSADPLAYQAKYMQDDMYYLDFSKVTEKSPKLYEQIHTETSMGSVGEGYLWIWRLFPESGYRTVDVPSDMYDAMIYVYQAHPITVLKE